MTKAAKRVLSAILAVVLMFASVPTVAVSGDDGESGCELCLGCPDCIRDFNSEDVTDEQLAAMIESGEIPAGVRWLGLSNNRITDISPLAELTNLQTLRLNENQITDISPLAELTELTELYLSENRIADLSPLAGLTGLQRLELNRNQITDLLPLAELTGLRVLWLSDNQITDISLLAGLTELRGLRLYSNQITDLSPLAGLTELRVLGLSNNQITDISPLAELTGLQELVLTLNQITDLSPLAGLTELQRLWLNFNQITDLSPLVGLAALRVLGLSNNQITDISPLAGLTELRRLWLNDNRITDISPLEGFFRQRDTDLDLSRNFLDFNDARTTDIIDTLQAARDRVRFGTFTFSPQWRISRIECHGCSRQGSRFLCGTDCRCSNIECLYCHPRAPGDVDGDGVVSLHDVLQILRYLRGMPNVIKDIETGEYNADARNAAAFNLSGDLNYDYCSADRPINVNHGHSILLRFEGLSSNFRTRNDVPLIKFRHFSSGLRGEICYSRQAVIYTTTVDTPPEDDIAFVFTVQPQIVGNVIPAGNSTPIRGFFEPEFEDFGTLFNVAESGVREIVVYGRYEIPAGSVIAFQLFRRNAAPPVPADFVLNAGHESGDIVWVLCECEGCVPPRMSDSCCTLWTVCIHRPHLYNAFGPGSGNVLNRARNGQQPDVQDALAILRFVVGLPSPISVCNHARAAANITSPLLSNPTLNDAVAILRFAIGLPGRLDRFWTE
jgi:Leucine-rich repeat (LRR) protein